MKYIYMLLIPIVAFAGEYYAKVEPVESYVITSKVSGKVTFANGDLEGKVAKDEVVVKIDDEVAKISYDVAKTTYEIKEEQYRKIESISSKSRTEKDNEKISFLNAKQAYITARDNYFSRTLKAEGLYIQDVKVKQGGFVNPGTALFEAMDISKSKVIVYVTREDLKDIESKKIVVAGEEGNFKLTRYSKVADSTYISSFKVELVGKAPEQFSDVVKVEIK